MIRKGIVLLVLSGLLIMVGAFVKIMHYEGADIILGIALIINFAAWGFLVYTLVKRKPQGG